MSVEKSQLQGRRNEYGDTLLLRLHEVLPAGVKVTVLADRGFDDQNLYAALADLGFDFIIRFRGVVLAQSRDGEVRPATGKVRLLQDAKVTADGYRVDSVVCVQARGMKAPWHLAVRGAMTRATAVKLYGRRFTIEETFRDTKDPRYGLGLSATHVRDPKRRDRLLLICAMATTLLTLLGAAGESLGMDRMLKVNMVKTRTHSLFRQGCHYYVSVPAMKPALLKPLVQRFGEFVLAQPVYVHAFGLKCADGSG